MHRFVAPCAFAIAVLAAGPSDAQNIATGTTTIPAAGRPNAVIVNGRRQVRHVRRGPKFYVVKPGDTLSAIAAKTNVSMTSLTSLNPSLATSPNSLQTGQRLRLRR